MKKILLLKAALFALAIQGQAQIVNNGFENWTNMGSYMEPEAYLTPNALTASSTYPVTRSTDHFPANVGSYSMRIQSDISLLPYDGFGIAMQNQSGVMDMGPGPGFPITGHPTSLTGYYKFEPQNGDTMLIFIILYSNGIPVSAGELSSTVAQSNWTPFDIDIPTYLSADSASILMSAYHAAGPPTEHWPYGNSVLYVDNLNFDTAISGTDELEMLNSIEIYPNPVNEILSLSFNKNTGEKLEAGLFDLSGKKVLQKNFNTKTEINVAELEEGIYFLHIKGDNTVYAEEKIIITH